MPAELPDQRDVRRPLDTLTSSIGRLLRPGPEDPGEVARAVASSRTFAPGTALIWEDDPADHVIVILSGRTKICVEQDGMERVLAELGPGQLAGERGTLHISVRSASVIAPAPVPVPRSPARQHPQLLNGENCTVLLSDVAGFGSRARTDDDRRMIREALFGMTHAALRGLPDVWSWDDRGDGLLTVIPPSVPTARIVQHLHRELPAVLDEYNRACHEAARIQLRMAVNVGPVASDVMGVTGEAIIVTAAGGCAAVQAGHDGQPGQPRRHRVDVRLRHRHQARPGSGGLRPGSGGRQGGQHAGLDAAVRPGGPAGFRVALPESRRTP
jgi:hypothetical protein